MSIIYLNEKNFDETVQNHDLVVVDFFATWCAPCMAFNPVLEQLSLEHPEVVFAKVDIDAEPALANDFNVRSIPLVMIFRREFAVLHHAGLQTAQSLKELIEQAKKIDIQSLREKIDTEE